MNVTSISQRYSVKHCHENASNTMCECVSHVLTEGKPNLGLFLVIPIMKLFIFYACLSIGG